MHSSSLTSKGQVTIPSKIRHQLGFHVGDKIGFAIEDDHVILFRKLDNIEAAFGIHKAKHTASLTDIENAIKKRGKDAGG